MGIFGKFFEIFMWFDSVFFLYVVEAIIYGGIFRSNCENFESKDDRNREEIFFFHILFSIMRSHFFMLSKSGIFFPLVFFSFFCSKINREALKRKGSKISI